MVLFKKVLNRNFYSTEKNVVKKHVYIHAKGYIETFYTDTYGNKQGLYTLVSRRTKLLMYESFYLDNKKIGIENFYDKDGTFTHSKVA